MKNSKFISFSDKLKEKGKCPGRKNPHLFMKNKLKEGKSGEYMGPLVI